LFLGKNQNQEKQQELKTVSFTQKEDLTEELKDPKATEYNLADFDEFFETKKVVHVPLKFTSQSE
jgi:16S rRNA (guanine527-N7)-methyltransferase